MKKDNLNLVDRIKSPTPKWFRIIRTIGITLTAVGGAIIASPVALPTAIVAVAGYLALSGTIATAVAQTAIQSEENGNEEEKKDLQPAEKAQ